MMERIVYDDDGQLLTGSFMDYAMPRARDVPHLEVHTIETPSPMNLLGAKGVGEAGTIGAPAAILNAALDALAPLGVTDLQMPLTPHRIWEAIKDSQKDLD
jgi:carbon-monoxide dehydrogenase large subunit